MQSCRVELDWIELGMAENETLDLRRSARWNQTRKLIKEGTRPRNVANEIVRCLRAIFKNLRVLHLPELIKEVLNPSGRLRHPQQQCVKAWEYVELVRQLGRVHGNEVDVLHALSEHVVDKFFDQERVRLELHPDGSDFHSFERYRESVRAELRNDLWVLAQQETESNDRVRSGRLPAPIPRESQEDLLQISLRGH